MLQQQQEQYIVASSQSFQNDSFFIIETPTSPEVVKETMDSAINLDLIPKNDFKKLIDLNNFKFLMNPKTCKNLNASPLVVILVHSAPDNSQKRETIRETWGRNDAHSLLIFLLGSVNSSNVQEKLEMENQIYGDLVQGNFHDSYHNMTYKHVMAFKWFVYECPKARFLLKTDDDVFINTPLLYNILENSSLPLHQKLNKNNLIYCNKIERARVKRTYRSKWRVTYHEYPGRYYPLSCPGFAILYSPDAVWALYHGAQKLPYFWIDDVHITGTVASNLSLSITPFDNMYLNYTVHKDLIDGHLNVEDEPFEFLFAQPNLVKMEIYKLWKLAGKSSSSSPTSSTVNKNKGEKMRSDSNVV